MNVEKVSAIVTGGASGLGEATVREIVKAGGTAVIADKDEDRGRKLESELADKVLFVKTDVTSEEDGTNLFEKAIARFGYINAVVNCAGIAHAEKVVGKERSHSLAAFLRVIQINLIGTFNITRLAAERMSKNDENEEGERGVIINTSSAAAFEGQIGQAAYSASKGGVASMTLPIARELARSGIRVVAIAPGLFKTPMFATLPAPAIEALGKMPPFPQRLGKPEEYGRLVRHIIENPMLNGEVIRLDGALRMQAK